MSFKNKTLVTVSFALFLFFGLYTFAQAEVKIIGDGDSIWSYPQISNGQVTWQTSGLIFDSNGLASWRDRLWFYNGAPQPTLLAASGLMSFSFNPSLDRGQVVWNESAMSYDNNGRLVSSNQEIFSYINGNRLQITNNLLYDPTNAFTVYQNSSPCVSNGQIVWQACAPVYKKDDNGNDYLVGWDNAIFLCNNDGMSLTKLVDMLVDPSAGGDNSSCYSPQIDNGFVVWQERTSSGEYVLHSSNKAQLSINGYYLYAPSISSGQAVWQGYDGITYQIYLYDGNTTTQITSGTVGSYDPHISNGKVVWESNGQIYLYDIASKTTVSLTPSTPMAYCSSPRISNNQAVWVNGSTLYLYDITSKAPPKPMDTGNISCFGKIAFDNGQVAWAGYDPVSGKLKVFLTGLQSLEMLDGSDFSAGTVISNNTTQLSTGGTAMQGAVTDGVTRLLLRMQTSDLNPVTFSVDGPTVNPLYTDNGFLQGINGQDNPPNVQSIKITPANVNGTNYAFAIYQAPGHFVRKGISTNNNNIDDDSLVSERAVTLTVKSNDQQAIATRDIKLDRPPLLLIHGLWSDPTMWNNLQPFLENQISGIKVYRVDYHSTNDAPFSKNKNVPYSYGSNVGDKDKGDSIKIIKATYKANKIAICQVDILAHSMGGVLARIWAGSGEGNNAYLRNKNFKSGDYHKLITLDTPHNGSFLADAGLACLRDPAVIAGNYQDINRLLTLLVSSGHSLSSGATDDLRTPQANPGGPIAVMDSTAVNVLTHAIVGHYVNFTVYSDLLFGALQISGLPGDYANMQNILDRHGFSTIPYIRDGSDLVVSNSSQQAGLGITYYLTLYHDHMHAVTLEVFNHLVDLLNADENSKLFTNGYPVAQQ